MRYKLLGKSGLRVSEMCLGTMTFGEEWGWGASKEVSKKSLRPMPEKVVILLILPTAIPKEQVKSLLVNLLKPIVNILYWLLNIHCSIKRMIQTRPGIIAKI